MDYNEYKNYCRTDRQREILQLYSVEKSNSRVARILDINESTVRRTLDKIRANKLNGNEYEESLFNINIPMEVSSIDEITNITKLKNEVQRLRGELNGFHNEMVDTEKVKNLILECNEYSFEKPKEWIESSHGSKNMNGIPVLFLSDLHYDEVVNPAEINGVNAYNRVIADNRLKYTFETTKRLLIDHMSEPNYDGFVLALGGDMLSGNIHEELSETNEATILQSILTLTDRLIEGIEYLEKNFGKVFVPCVVGNHGRLYKKPRMKQKVYNNYEYLVYQYLAKYFMNNKNVIIEVSDGADLLFTIYDKRFLLTHGDQFKGGNGIAGVLSPIMMGLHKKSKNYSMIDKPFDIMLVGHFHQYISTNSVVINGSMKGYDEYAFNCNFTYEDPQQALFIMHPKHGMTYRMPVICNAYDKSDKTKNKDIIKVIL